MPASKEGTAFARLIGKQRHVTIYPNLKGRGAEPEVLPVTEDFTLAEGDVMLKENDWFRFTDWTELEPWVFVSRVIRA
jgi:hypothetical protein